MTLRFSVIYIYNGSTSDEVISITLILDLNIDFADVSMILETGDVEVCLMRWTNYQQQSLMHINGHLNLGTYILVIFTL